MLPLQHSDNCSLIFINLNIALALHVDGAYPKISVMLSHSLTSPICGYTHDSLRGKVPKFHVVPPIFPIILFQARWSKPVTTQASADPSGHISNHRAALQIDFGLELQNIYIYIYFVFFSFLLFAV